MDIQPFTLNLREMGIKTNKDISGNQLLALYKVHKVGKKGHGLFARRDISKNEVIILATGPIVDLEVVVVLYWSYGIDICIKCSPNKYILPNNESRFINHSCEPNMGVLNGIKFVARRDIKKGEELTFDYCMTDCDDWEMDCFCTTASCRIKISGTDIFNPKYNLAQKYQGYLPKFVLREIRKRQKG